MKRGLLTTVAALGLPAPALACPACDWGTSNALGAYVATAALMSALPLLLIAAIGWWLYRRLRTGATPRYEPATPTREAASIPARHAP